MGGNIIESYGALLPLIANKKTAAVILTITPQLFLSEEVNKVLIWDVPPTIVLFAWVSELNLLARMFDDNNFDLHFLPWSNFTTTQDATGPKNIPYCAYLHISLLDQTPQPKFPILIATSLEIQLLAVLKQSKYTLPGF